jgi:hypothetical protein
MRRTLAVMAFSVAAFALGALYGTRSASNDDQTAFLKQELERYEEALRRSSEQQHKRAAQMAALSQQVSAYELELANGVSNACPSDPAYERRLRGILGSDQATPAGN